MNNIVRNAESLRDRRKLALAKVNDEEASHERAKERLRVELEAQSIIQIVSQTVQQQAHERIAGVVSRCLASVFDDPYEFVIRFDRKRGRTEAVLVFARKDNEVTPTFGSGGGVLDVAGFALRLACLSLTRPPLRKILCLDEPFRHVHGDRNRERVRELIETLPRELGIQVILITGLEWLVTGKVVEL